VRYRLAGLLFVFCITAATLAQGQVVTYTFSGTSDGDVGGTPFTAAAYTFTVHANAGTVQNSSYPYSNVLTSGTITIAGTACASGCSISNASNYLVFNTGPTQSLVHGISVVGHLDVNGFTLIEGCWDCGPPTVNDNLVSVVPPTASGADGAEAPYLAFATSGGNVQLTRLDGEITYAVALGAGATTSAVPTLSDEGLLLLAGLMLLAAARTLRRRAG